MKLGQYLYWKNCVCVSCLWLGDSFCTSWLSRLTVIQKKWFAVFAAGGGGRRSHNYNMNVSFISSELLILLQSGLVWWHIIIAKMFCEKVGVLCSEWWSRQRLKIWLYVHLFHTRITVQPHSIFRTDEPVVTKLEKSNESSWNQSVIWRVCSLFSNYWPLCSQTSFDGTSSLSFWERLDCSGHGRSNSSKVHWMFDNPIFSVPLHTDLFETKLCQCIDALLVMNRPSECIDSSTVTPTITRHLTGMFRHARGHILFCEECALTCNFDASLKYVSVLAKSWPARIMFCFRIM